MKYGIACIISLLLLTSYASAGLIPLTTDANWALPLSNGEILYEEGHGAGIKLYDAVRGTTTKWAVMYNFERAGWLAPPGSLAAAASPDGKWIAVAYDAEPRALPGKPSVDEQVALVVLSSQEGQQAHAVALCQPAGRQLLLHFTRDSSRLVLAPTLPIRITPAALRQWAGSQGVKTSMPHFDYLELKSQHYGAYKDFARYRRFEPDVRGDSALCAPADPGPATTYAIYDLASGKQTGSYKPGPPCGLKMNGWLAPDTMLVTLVDSNTGEERQGLLDARGHFSATPKPAVWLGCRLDDGSCIFSLDQGRNLKCGKLERPACLSLKAVAAPWSGEAITELRVRDMPGPHGLIVDDGRSGKLWYLPEGDLPGL